ncbi:MAG: carbon-nitrogen hydrolase [Gammaproteobacteria bacterium]|nr:carbon-nitrogen hydrolase [Gammaproteobacteria bacterium]
MPKIALIQHSCSDSPEKNRQLIEQKIIDAAESGAELIVLQELHNSVYFCQNEDTRHFDLAETIPGPSTELFGRLAEQLKLVIVCSLFEKRARGLYHNTAVVFDRSKTMAGIYRKMHIPDDPGYYEKYYFTPGDLGFEPIKTSVGKLGVLICWDQWFPEAARLMALKGADILLYPTAIGWDPGDTKEQQQRQQDAWITVQRGHAIANGIFVAACNRIGFEADASGHTAGSQFWGNSFICDPQGAILAQADDRSEMILTAEINFERIEQVRRVWPYFRDRRIGAYGDILKRFAD